MRALLAVMMLAGCATGPLAPEGTDFVQISSVGPFSGINSDTIFANDAHRKRVSVINSSETRISWSMLPDGSYASARAILERGMPRLTEPNFYLCPTDVTVQSIMVSVPVAGETSVSDGCLPNGFGPLATELRALLPPWSLDARRRGAS